MTSQEAKLPKIPSKLIRIALYDLELCMRDDDYIIDFGIYHGPKETESQFNKDKSCSVCFAGSVMAKSLGADYNEVLSPRDFGDDRVSLTSLDYLRLGEIDSAIYPLGLKTELEDRKIPQNDYQEFVEAMNKLADDLEREGN